MPRRISNKYQSLDERIYTREEMESITGIPQSNHNFKRCVETWLETYGYSWEMTRTRGGDFRITSKAETAEQKFHTLMIDTLGLDRQTQPAEFAYYIYFLMTYPNAEVMPLVEQQERINQIYGRSFGSSTIQTWQNKLQAAGVVDKDMSKNYWKTVSVRAVDENGEVFHTGRKERYFIEDRREDPDYSLYWKRLNEILRENEARTGNRCWEQTLSQMWNEMGMIIYSCPARLINIIGDHAQEVCGLAQAVVEADMERLNKTFPSNEDRTN